MLLVVLPASLMLTWVWKQSEASRNPAGRVQAEYIDAPDSSLYDQARTTIYRAPVVQRCLDDERDALRVAGAGLGGPGWVGNRSGWTHADCCAWPGVTCSERGRVKSLALAHRGLSGTIPTALAELRALSSLDLNENGELSGTLPPALGSLPELSQLYLFGTRISGVLPAQLVGARAISELELSDCRLSGT